ncbi:MAG: ribose-phosphate diphosphokinase [Desulfurococcaceae archaeon]
MAFVVGVPGYWLAKEVANLSGYYFINSQEKEFPDGELYIRVTEPDKIHDNDGLIVSTFYPSQDKMFLKTLLLVNAVKNSGAKKVSALIPYLAYSRQDKAFMPGEPISSCVIVESLKAVGVDVLVTVDVHSPRVLECFKGNSINVIVSDILIRRAMSSLENPVVIAPDRGAIERVSFAANAYGLEYDYLIKQRDRITGEVTYTPKELSVKKRDIIMVDDIISTGGTIAESAKILLRNGARRIIVVATHGLLVGNALERLESAGVQKVILADTLGMRHVHFLVDYVNITQRIVDELKRALNY